MDRTATMPGRAPPSASMPAFKLSAQQPPSVSADRTLDAPPPNLDDADRLAWDDDERRGPDLRHDPAAMARPSTKRPVRGAEARQGLSKPLPLSAPSSGPRADRSRSWSSPRRPHRQWPRTCRRSSRPRAVGTTRDRPLPHNGAERRSSPVPDGSANATRTIDASRRGSLSRRSSQTGSPLPVALRRSSCRARRVARSTARELGAVRLVSQPPAPMIAVSVGVRRAAKMFGRTRARKPHRQSAECSKFS